MTDTPSVRPTFEQACKRHSLNPQKTTKRRLATVMRGGRGSLSNFEIACLDHRLDPKTTSFTKLASAQLGEDRELTIEEITAQMGKDWLVKACEFDWLPPAQR